MIVGLGTSLSPTNVVVLTNVSRFYISLASKDNPDNYVKLENLDECGVILSELPPPEDLMYVYVIEHFDSKPRVFPIEKVTINYVGETNG